MGSNNSAKSIVLEALLLASNPFRALSPAVSYPIDFLINKHTTVEDNVGAAFLFYNYISDRAKIAVDGRELNLYKDKDNAVYFSLEGSLEGQFSKSPINIDGTSITGNWIGIVYPSGMKNPYYKGKGITGDAFLFDPRTMSAMLKIIMDNWINVVNSGILSKVALEMSEFSHEKYVNFTQEPFYNQIYTIYAFTENGSRIRLSDLGEGMQVYFATRVIYELLKPEFLLWDDIEAHFNPRIIAHVANWFSDLVSSGKSVIIATHSLEAAKLIARANEGTVIIARSLEDGKLKSRELKLDELEEFERAGIDVRMAEGFLL